jgi:hypothetical protein
MSFSQPSPPDPGITAAIQSNANQNAAQAAADLGRGNLSTPFGSNQYTRDGLTQSLSQPVANQVQQFQNLQDQYHQTQDQVGRNAAFPLTSSFGQLYGSAPDFNAMTSPQVQAQMQAFNNYQRPLWTQQESNLDSKLHNQGIGQGSTAWNNAQRGQMSAEDMAQQGALMNFMPQAQNMALQAYAAPMQTLAGLLNITAPGAAGMPGAAAAGTQLPFTTAYMPQETIQPANYAGLAQNQFLGQQQQFQNTMSGLGTIGSGLVGALGLGNGGLGGLFGLGTSGAGGGGVA